MIAEADVRCEAGMTDARLDAMPGRFAASASGSLGQFAKRFPEAMPGRRRHGRRPAA